MKTELCIGLFGTCGDSQWRDPFIARFKALGCNYFNPQLPTGTWKPEDATIEAMHLAMDSIICFPVTDETYAFGSLGEVGFSIINSIRLNTQRNVIVMIQPRVCTALDILNPTFAKESNKARHLVIEHLKKLELANLFVVNSLEDMLSIATLCYAQQRAYMETRIQLQMRVK